MTSETYFGCEDVNWFWLVPDESVCFNSNGIWSAESSTDMLGIICRSIMIILKYVRVRITCEVWGCDGGHCEDIRLLGYDTLLYDRNIPLFRRNTVHLRVKRVLWKWTPYARKRLSYLGFLLVACRLYNSYSKNLFVPESVVWWWMLWSQIMPRIFFLTGKYKTIQRMGF